MSKALLIPIIALVALVIKQFTQFELSQVEIDLIAEGLLAAITLVGIFMHPRKEETKDDDEVE